MLYLRHPEREEIDLAIVSGVSQRTIASRWFVSRAAVQRHALRHVSPALAAMQAEREARAAITLLECPREALEAGRHDEARQERARLDAERRKAENARNNAVAEAHTASLRLNQARTAAAAIRAKLEALATVAEPDAAALAPLMKGVAAADARIAAARLVVGQSA